MTPHCKIYMKHFDLGMDDVWQCEACTVQRPINNGLEIHHINGRGKGKDIIHNLMCLCRKCHNLAHSSVNKETMQTIHNYFLAGVRKTFLK